MQEFSAVEGSWVHSENESRGRLHPAAEVRKILFVVKRRESLRGGTQWDPGNQWSPGSGWKLGFIAFLYA
jgi:hypothetical protein